MNILLVLYEKKRSELGKILLSVILLSVSYFDAMANDSISDHYIIVLKDQVSSKQTSSQNRTAQRSAKQSVDSVIDNIMTAVEQQQYALQRTQSNKNAKSIVIRNRVTNRYFGALNGFTATLSASAKKLVESRSEVMLVEQDSIDQLDITQLSPPSWGLDRVDQSVEVLNSSYRYDTSGNGVHAYIIDSGVRTGHEEFAGRMGVGKSFISDSSIEDCKGHGTHVAGIIGGITTGLAKAVTLHPLRVSACSGGSKVSAMIAAMNWVAENGIKPGVVNISISGKSSTARKIAVDNLVSQGFVVVVSAGNDDDKACKKSPASIASAITVASIIQGDRRSSFSNFGRCIDLFAPGNNIYSALANSNNHYGIASGTSMAAPHVAGVVARYLGQNPTATPDQVWQAMLSATLKNKIVDAGTNSPNRLLQSNYTNVHNPPKIDFVTFRNQKIPVPIQFE